MRVCVNNSDDDNDGNVKIIMITVITF